TQFQVGNRVAGCFFQRWVAGEISADVHKSALGGAVDGVLAEYRTFREQGLVPLPAGYSFEEGATLPCAALTAWQSLITRGRLSPGESVLLLGTGGVSVFGLQFAKMAGAKTIVTSGSDEKLQRARRMGADEVINYKSDPDWGKKAARLAGDGVDHVVEVGGAGTFTQSIQAAKFCGKIGLIGILSGRGAPSEIFPVVHKCLTVFGIYVGSREMFLAMNRAIEQSNIKPVIDKVFAFDNAREAYAYVQSAAHFGKVVIRVAE
ncbi:MAG: NAD(P)-dependent alcohol dehydrogenase, partial [Verrucomicrobia bacterium]|nr:NAD(P)-dependent alcohol dehydrogenase [Verrucomicrobiota bacterium]